MTGGPPPDAALDHLIVAAATLADGIEYIAGITGVTPHPGGKHVSGAVEADDESRLGDRVALLAQVEHEEDRDEAPEAIDEGSGAEDPDRPWQLSDSGPQRLSFLRHPATEPSAVVRQGRQRG